MSQSLISPETVSEMELRMDPLEIYACIFLLYDTVETALQVICNEIQTCRRYLPVLDSVLFKGGAFHDEGPLVKWAKSLVGKGINWQERLLEALLIIKEFWLIKFLNASQRDLELRFLPHQANTSYHVDLVRKVLYLMVDDLSKDEWNELQNLIIEETKLTKLPAMFSEIPECLMLILMSRNFIQIKKKDQRVNLSLLYSCLKRMGKDYWAHQLKSIENAVNEEPGFSVEHDKNVACRKVPSVRFNLDPKNPGTILIFNVMNYDGKTLNDMPLTTRDGSHVDEKRLLSTFDLLGFKRIVKLNPKADDIILIIRETLAKFCSEAKKSKQERCFAIAILAHGDREGFYCTEGNLVSWDSIRNELRHSDTKGLARLLLIQACKGDSQVTKSEEPDYDIEEDGPGSESDSHSKNLKDLFELSSSVAGFAAYRSIVHGSFFMRSFCKQILQFGNDFDLHQITTLINKDLDSKVIHCSDRPISMTAEMTVTAKKLLYLGVPQNEKLKAESLVQEWEHFEETECTPRSPTVYLQQDVEVKNNGIEDKSILTERPNKDDDGGENAEELKETSPIQFNDLKIDLKNIALQLGEKSRHQ